MDPRILERVCAVVFLCGLGASLGITLPSLMAAEQEARDKRVAKLSIERPIAWTFQDENQWGKFPEKWR